MTTKLAELEAEHAKALAGGGEKYVERHHDRGKLTARERIELLLDPDSPVPRAEPARGVGHRLHGRRQRRGRASARSSGVECLIVANDPTVKGGTSNPWTLKKILRANQIALQNRLAGDLPGGIGRRRPADAEGDLHPRRPDVPRPDPAVGSGHPDHRAGVRQLHRRRCLHPRHVRPRRDDQGTLEGVPGRAAAGEDGHRRGVRRRIAWRCRNARPHFGSGGLLRRRRARRHPDRPPHRRPAQLAQTGTDTGPGHRAAVRRRRTARHRSLRPAYPVRPARCHRPHRRRFGLRRVQAAVRLVAGDRLGHAVRLSDRHPRQPPRRAVQRGVAEGHPVHPAGQPVRHATVCSCTTPPATWSASSTKKAG